MRRFCSSVKSHFNEHDEHASKTQLCIDVDGLYAAFLYPRDQVAINLTTISALLVHLGQLSNMIIDGADYEK